VSIARELDLEVQGQDWLFYPAVESHLVRSSHVAQTFKIQVMQPVRRRGETTRFPVVYATDGNLAFDVLKGISYAMQKSESDAPRFILVGIGYPSDCPVAGNVLRARDLTFPGYPDCRFPPPSVEGVLLPERGGKEYVGGEDFQLFIQRELVPMIDEKYHTQPGERTYFGHSAGGGFGLFTLLSRPDLFNNYIISSPGVTYNGISRSGVVYDNYEFLLKRARQFAESGRALPGLRMYLSVGSEEEFEPAYAKWQLTSSFYRLATFLKSAAIPGLKLSTEIFSGETHMTVWPMAFVHGIQAVFGTGPRR